MLCKYFNYLLKLVYPLSCCYCGSNINLSNYSLCRKCYSKLYIADKDLYSSALSKVLEQHYTINIDKRVTSYMVFNDNLTRSILHKIKYGSDLSLAKFMGCAYAKYLKKLKIPYLKDIDVIIPVPLSKKKLRLRGYNQSEIIASEILKITSKAVLATDILLKSKDTVAQATKNAQERVINIVNAFCIKKSIYTLEGKHILLVDDVFTTGATMACIIKKIVSKIQNIKISVAVLAYRPLVNNS